MTAAGFGQYLKRRWWVVVAVAFLTVVGVVAVTAATAETTYTRTTHFVLHPDAASSTGEVNNSVDVLQHDGPLVQTVLRVLESDEISARAARAADISDVSGYGLATSVAPGTSLFDVEARGPSRTTVDDLGDAVEEVAPAYVALSYKGFALDVLGRASATTGGAWPSADVVGLGFLLAVAAAVGLLFLTYVVRHAPARAVVVDVSRSSGGDVDEVVEEDRERDEDQAAARTSPRAVPAKARRRPAPRKRSAAS
jgi:capsular polysaccharide biosynthesis protein